MKRTDQSPSPAAIVDRLVAEIRAGGTRAHGLKVLEAGEAIVVHGDDGIRRLDSGWADELDRSIAAASDEVSETAERLDDTETRLEEAAGRIAETSEMLTALDEQAAELTEQSKTIVADMAADRERLEQTTTALSELTPRIGNVEGALADSEQKLATATATAEAAAEAAEDAKSISDSLQAKLDAALAAKPGLVQDSSFETTDSWITYYGTEIKPDPRAASGKSVWYAPPASISGDTPALVYARTWAEVTAGRRYRITVRVMVEAEPAEDRLRLVSRRGDPVVSKVAASGPRLADQDLVVGQWALVQWEWEPAESDRYQLGLQINYQKVGALVDDFQVVDITDEADLALQVADAKRAATEAAEAAQAAAKTAGQALDSASGRATIRHSTTAPQGVGTATGDAWFQWDRFPGGTVTGQWTWDGRDWQPQQLSHQVISSVDLGTATVGKLHGSYLEAYSVETEQLAVGVGGNALADPGFASTTMTDERMKTSAGMWTAVRSGATPYVVSAATTAAVAFRFGSMTAAKMMPTVGGQRWRIAVPVNPGGGQARINVRWFNAAGSQFYIAASFYTTASTRTELTAIWEAPATAVGFLVDVYSPTSSTERAVEVHAGGSVRSMTDAVLIADGTITGPKVDARSVAGAIGRFVKVEAENVDVTDKLAARVLSAADTQTVNAFVEKNLVVGPDGVLDVLGAAIVNDLNARGTIRGRDAILDGTLDVEQLNVTEDLAAKVVSAMRTETRELVVTESAVLQHVEAIEGIVTPLVEASETRTRQLIAQKASIEDIEAGNLTLTGHFRSGAPGKPGVIIPSAYTTRNDQQQLGVWLAHDGTAPSLGSEWGATGGMWIDQAVMKGGAASAQSSPLYVRGQNGAGVRVMGGLSVGNSQGNALITPAGSGNVNINARLGDADLNAGRFASVIGGTTANLITGGDLYLKGSRSIRLTDTADNPYLRSWTAGGLKTVYMGGSSGILYTETSSARYKVDIATAEPDHDWLDMRTVTYRDRLAVELAEEIEARRAAGDCTPLTSEESERLAIADRHVHGRIAEEGAEVADEQVVRNADGTIEGWDYSRDGVMLTPHVREHRDRLADHDEQLADLARRIAELEQDTTTGGSR